MEILGLKALDTLEAFSKVTDIPLTFFDNDKVIKWECNSEGRICNFFDVYRTKNSICTSGIASAAEIAARLGEPYVFSCKVGFINIVIALILRGEMQGFFVAGPIAMESIRSETITNILNINDLNKHPETISALTIFLRTMKIYSTKEVKYLSIVLNSSIMAAITPNEDYLKINELYKKMSTLDRREKGAQGKRRDEPENYIPEGQKKEKSPAVYGGRSNIINQAVQIIKTGYMHKISLEKVAGKLYINQSYLSMHFKHEMGVTFTDYLSEIRILESKELLANTNYSLMEVSMNCGFEDQSYFTKVFKKSQGCTPKEYRQAHQKVFGR